MMLTERVGIITGGPGTGKSTIVKAVLDRLPKGQYVGIAAPTGKAAKRVTEVTGYPAMTIHRLLGAKAGSDGWSFDFHAGCPLPHQVLLIDESSMLDAEIADHLLQAINVYKTRVFFIGDADQLPSVGPGQVFADMIRSERMPMVRLTQVHRSALKSWVCRNSPLILEGDIDILTTCDDFRYYRRDDPEVLARDLVDLVVNKMPRSGAKDIQVLTPQNGGQIGVEMMNNYLQSKINPVVRGDESRTWSIRAPRGTTYQFRENDKVIATANDYDRGVFNGEVGIIKLIDPERSKMFVDFDHTTAEYGREDSRTLRLAYALTVHKSQGSEWDWIVVACHEEHEYMWSRQLLYTAVTRAKKGVVIIGNDAGLGAALSNDEPRQRRTTLTENLLALA